MSALAIKNIVKYVLQNNIAVEESGYLADALYMLVNGLSAANRKSLFRDQDVAAIYAAAKMYVEGKVF